MRKLTSIVLALIVLLSSGGLTYAAHYCGSFRMMETLTYGKASLSCGMVMTSPACEDQHDQDHDCCDNEYQDVLKDDHFAKSQFDADLKVSFKNYTPAVFSLPLLEFKSTAVISHPPYRPPPPKVKRYLLLEVFLI